MWHCNNDPLFPLKHVFVFTMFFFIFFVLSICGEGLQKKRQTNKQTKNKQQQQRRHPICSSSGGTPALLDLLTGVELSSGAGTPEKWWRSATVMLKYGYTIVIPWLKPMVTTINVHLWFTLIYCTSKLSSDLLNCHLIIYKNCTMICSTSFWYRATGSFWPGGVLGATAALRPTDVCEAQGRQSEDTSTVKFCCEDEVLGCFGIII